jgi:hypothetical protein
MTFVLALLAMYPDVQKRFLQEIKDVVGNGRIPVCGVYYDICLYRSTYVNRLMRMYQN